jgi:proteasome assembly chaperone (PAC2) family protein
VTENGPLHFLTELELDAPTLLLAYGGWSNAGDSATSAIGYLFEELHAAPLAWIDTEDFLDFTVSRPQARIDPEGCREIVWPRHEFFSVELEGSSGDLILGLGIEPHLRWRSYARAVLELVRRCRVARVVLLGAYLADVIYSQPIHVGGYSSDPAFAAEFGFGEPSYEGPTGILGVLADLFREESVPTVSLWASLPHYVTVTPNSRGALALLNEVRRVGGLSIDVSRLEGQAADFDEKVSELIASDPQLSAYVRELKKRAFSQ